MESNKLKKRTFLLYVLLATTSTLCLAESAEAANSIQAEGSQETGRVSETAPPTEDSGDIVVTAQLRAQNLQDVPAAITAVSGADLLKTGTNSLADAARLVPSLRISSVRSQTLIFIRGVGQTLTTVNADPQVAVHMNGVYLPNEMTSSAFYDVERIEVVPGPQGTLYGRNATGGVINIVSRQPREEFSANGFVELGNFGRVQALLAADLPITDGLAIRPAVTMIRHDGYYDNGMNDQQTVSGRLTAVWRPLVGTKVSAALSYSHDGGFGDVVQNVPPANGDWWHVPFDPKAEGLYTDITTKLASLTVAHDLNDSLTLTYVGGYNQLNRHGKGTSFVGPPLGPNIDKLSTRTFSHEARVNGSWDRVDAVLGIYYFNSKAHPEFASIRTGRSDIADYIVKSQAKAAFGQLTYSVFDELRVTGGLRYTSQKRELDGETRIFPVGAAFDVYRGKRSEDRLDWRLGVEYDLTPASMLYANVATGFTAGGFANTSGGRANAAAFPFESVTLTAYTAGSKNSMANGALMLNFEGFYYDYKNYQVSQRNAITGLNLIFNAEQAEVYGAQLDTRLNFSSADQLSLGVAYVHAEAIRLRTSAGIFDGYTLPYSPKWTVNGSYSHTFDLANGGDLEALINTSYASDRWAFYSHPRGGLIPGNTTTNVSLIYNEPGQRWSLSGWVRNLEDNLTQGVGLVGVPRADSAYFLMPPRTFGATFSFNY